MKRIFILIVILVCVITHPPLKAQTSPSWSQVKTTNNIAAMLLLKPTTHGVQVSVDGYYTITIGWEDIP